MKSNVFKVAAMAVVMMASAQVNAQTVSDVIGNVLNNQQSGDLVQGLTSVFFEQQAGNCRQDYRHMGLLGASYCLYLRQYPGKSCIEDCC